MRTSGERGFSMVEVAVVVALMMIVLAMAVYSIGTSLPNYKVDIAMNSVYSTLRLARQMAISQRRNIQVQFSTSDSTNTGEIVLTQLAPNAGFGGPVAMGNYPWEGGATFHNFGVGDTPMQFCAGMGGNCTCGGSDAVCFNGIAGGPATMEFTPTGAFIDGTTLGVNPTTAINGTIYLGILPTGASPSQWSHTARAVTVLGATGRVRQYRWDGANWQE